MLSQVIILWLKDNWTYVVIVVLLCILLLMGWGKCSSDNLYDKLMQDYNSQSKAFKKQINILEATNKELREKQEILNEKHKEEMARVEKDYQNNLNTIIKNAKTSKNIIVKEARRDPTTLTDRITQTFGIPVVVQ
jgi:predicted RND superfamily exporter protein